MKKILCLLCCAVIAVSMTACTEQKKDDRTSREIKLVQPSEVSREISDTDEEDEADEEKDLTESFVISPKLSELPEYMRTNPKLYAELLGNILKIYYSGILSGRINSDIYKHRYSEDKLPPESATAEQRRSAAEYCTIGGALEYFGYDNKNYIKYYEMYNGCLTFFCFDKDANIYYRNDIPSDNVMPLTGFSYGLYFIFRYAKIDKLEREALEFAADEISSAVSNYYSGIRDGKITSSKKLKYTADKLPEKNADESERKKCADEATIQGAVDFAGYYTSLYPCITKLGYNKKSELFTLPDLNDPDIVSIGSPETKLSVLYK